MPCFLWTCVMEDRWWLGWLVAGSCWQFTSRHLGKREMGGAGFPQLPLRTYSDDLILHSRSFFLVPHPIASWAVGHTFDT